MTNNSNKMLIKEPGGQKHLKQKVDQQPKDIIKILKRKEVNNWHGPQNNNVDFDFVRSKHITL